MRDAYIVSMARTPVGKCGGKLAPVKAEMLGAAVLKQVVNDIELDPENVDEVIMGNLWAHDLAHAGRVALLEAGFPVTVPSLRVDRQCASALDAIMLAAMYIQTGHADIVIGGGVESDSRRPYVQFKAEKPYSTANPKFLKRYVASPEWMNNPAMGETAENLAEQFELTREELDDFAYLSHKRAAAAWENGNLAPHVVPITVKTRKDTYVVDKDETIRWNISKEDLAKLPALFRKDGIVTAGNSCPMSDGASAVCLMSGEEMKKRGLKPIAKFVDFASVGVDPNYMGIGPARAIPKLLKQTGLTLDDIDVIEMNEAFAAQMLACLKTLDLNMTKVNLDGGALALGHPLAATGGVLTVKLLNQLERLDKRYGIVSFCCGGGQGAAALFERV